MNTRSLSVTIAVLGLTLAAFAAPALGQEYHWTWMKGADVIDQPGVYGEIGVPDEVNTPGARQGSVSWADEAGHFWLFGGAEIIDSNDGMIFSQFNDLWRYDPDTGNWTWMKGSDVINQPGVYGEIGVPAEANTPGARLFPVSWTDDAGDLWLFGGMGFDKDGSLGLLNDLWRYDPATGNWTWMKGADVIDQPGEYGEIGVPAEGNTPGARCASVSWTDDAGRLWLFGGVDVDFDEGSHLYFNDLWRYDPDTGNWTWMKGADVVDQPGVYGEIGVPAEANTPGARHKCVSWIDGADQLWLFGGWGLDKDGSDGFLNDLWRYDPDTGDWTWMKGADVVDQPGEYGEIGVPDEANTPGSRNHSVTWTDAAGRLWLFGGHGDGDLNDLWRYDPDTGNWTWMKGADVPHQPGVYGEIGVPAEANTPGAREGSVSWTDDSGNFWLFGGKGLDKDGSQGSLNDLWRLHLHAPPEPTPPPTPMPTPVPVTGGIWYLPAGGTQVGGEAFDTYILISNPVYAHAEVEVRYVGTDQEYGTVHQRVKERTRHTENMADTVGAGQENVAAIVRSTNDVPIIVERAMYFPSGPANWTGSHNTIGLDTVGTDWFLAEGATHIFDQYVHILNPGTQPSDVTVTFFSQDEQAGQVSRVLDGLRVWTVKAEEETGIRDQLSTRVESDRPVAVDRTMYWPKGNWEDGHATVGVTDFAEEWYLPEGATHIFNQYVLVANPSETETASVDFTFTDQHGNIWTAARTVPPQRRETVNVNDVAGSVTQISTRISSDIDVAAERAMYWPVVPSAGWTGGHDTVGVSQPKTTWQLPEGATHIFDQYVLVANPGDIPAEVTFIFQGTEGELDRHEAVVEPGRRYTVKVNDVVGPVNEVSTTVTSNVPVVAERAMYFGTPWKTGHVTVGVGQ